MEKYSSLIQSAINAISMSHPRHPQQLRFGSAVLTRQGKIYSASGYWSETASLVLHAEQAALAHAAAHDEYDIEIIACVSSEDPQGEKICHPCGVCKQLIYENFINSGIDIEVLMANKKGKYVVKRISELSPYPWP